MLILLLEKNTKKTYWNITVELPKAFQNFVNFIRNCE